MKKLISFILITFVFNLAACGAIEKQVRVNILMEDLVFDVPAEHVYKTTVSFFPKSNLQENILLPLHGIQQMKHSKIKNFRKKFVTLLEY